MIRRQNIHSYSDSFAADSCIPCKAACDSAIRVDSGRLSHFMLSTFDSFVLVRLDCQPYKKSNIKKVRPSRRKRVILKKITGRFYFLAQGKINTRFGESRYNEGVIYIYICTARLRTGVAARIFCAVFQEGKCPLRAAACGGIRGGLGGRMPSP